MTGAGLIFFFFFFFSRCFLFSYILLRALARRLRWCHAFLHRSANMGPQFHSLAGAGLSGVFARSLQYSGTRKQDPPAVWVTGGAHRFVSPTSSHLLQHHPRTEDLMVSQGDGRDRLGLRSERGALHVERVLPLHVETPPGLITQGSAERSCLAAALMTGAASAIALEWRAMFFFYSFFTFPHTRLFIPSTSTRCESALRPRGEPGQSRLFLTWLIWTIHIGRVLPTEIEWVQGPRRPGIDHFAHGRQIKNTRGPTR